MKHTNWIMAAAVVLASVSPAEIISFRQGDLRIDGVLVMSNYVTQATSLRGTTQADEVADGLINWIGDNGARAGSPMRGLYGFDLSYIKTLAKGQPYIINSVQLNLTVMRANDKFGGNHQFSLNLSKPFDETTATFNNPGIGHDAGGTIGTALTQVMVTSKAANTKGEKLTFASTRPFVNAVSNALSSADGTIHMIVKKTTEEGVINRYFRPASNDSTSIDVRPELVVDFTVIGNRKN
ncbi:MAG: hypothetical protein WC959_09485 [Kiritimatiellales bacterium]